MRWKGLKRWKTQNIINELPKLKEELRRQQEIENLEGILHFQESIVAFSNELERRRKNGNTRRAKTN